MHLELDPAANPPSGANIEKPQMEKDVMDIDRRRRITYLFVGGEWWMEGKMRVTKFSERTNFDL